MDVTLAGNSTSAGAGYILVSSGTLTLAGGNNITLSQNGNHVSIIGAAAGTGAGISGVSAGTQLGTSGTISFANSNNITFGMAGSSVITASFAGGSFTGGVSSGGNTLGTTGTVSNGILLVGGTNITLSQSSGAGGATVTVIGPAPGGQTGISGIAGSGASTATSGTVQFANSNNITFGLNGNTITASFSQSVQPAQTGISSIQASDATYTSGGVIFTGSGIVTVQSGTGQNVVINASTSQSLQTSGLFQATLAGNSTSAGGGYILFSSGTVTIAGGNNITLSQNGNAFTISGPNAAGAQTGISGIAGSAASTVTAGTVQFANSNNMSFGLNGSTMTASFSVTNTIPPIATQVYAVAGVGSTGTVTRFSPEDHVHVGVAGIVASGTATTFQGNLVLSGGSNITLSTSGNATAGSIIIVGASGGAGGATLSQWMAPGFGFSTFSQMGQSSLVFFPAQLQQNGIFSRADFFGSQSVSTSSNSSFGGTISLLAGIYTRNVSTLSLATSARSPTRGRSPRTAPAPTRGSGPSRSRSPPR